MTCIVHLNMPGIVSAVIYWSQGKGAGGLSSFSTATESVMKGASPRGPPEGAVLVFGASGKTGRVLVGEVKSIQLPGTYE
jgi:hypothetical protein